MRWFCTQPDIVEDVHNVRYHTKSSAGAVGSFLSPSSRRASTKTNRTPASYNGTVSDSGARLRTAASTGSHGGKKSFGSDGHGAAVVGISGPIPIESSAPAKMNFLQVSPPPMIVATHNTGPPVNMEDMQRDKSKSLDIPGAGMVTDSEREGLPKQLRRKSRRMSAPLAALGIHVGSGTDTDATTKRRRVSKVMIGAPEGFKHEGHVGMGGTFASSPEVPDSWNVEAWRAEIERTLTSTTTPQSLSRPKGPRPTSSSSPVTPQEMTYPPTASGPNSGTPPRNRYRRSVDGAGPRRSIDGYGGSSGAMTDAPTRPMTAPNRARSGSGGGGSQHRRSRSGSQNQTQADHGGAMSANEQSTGSGRMRGMEHGHSASLGYAGGHYGHSQSHGLGHSYSHSQPHPHPHGRENGHGHTLGKDSITSLASIPTFTTTSTAHTTLVTPNTTSTSLSRSLSDKPQYPTHYPSHYSNGHYQQQHQQYHQHLAHLGQSHSSYYHNGPGQPGTGKGSVILQRSSSATAALPPSSTSSSATVASMTSTASSATAYGGGLGYAGSISGAGSTGRKPIPAQRRKPVPQHLPATAEVSPFPTLLVVGSGGGGGNADKRGSFPFDVNVKGERPREREALADRGVDVGEQAVGPAGTGASLAPPVPTKVPKELVPLLGVPSDEAHYVTKSTKARWDGAMAEIASALRDPNTEAPPV